MSLFKIKVIPLRKSSNWRVNQVQAGRKEKVCEICLGVIKIGEPSDVFLRRDRVGLRKEYRTRVAHPGICSHHLYDKINNEELERSTDTPTDAG